MVCLACAASLSDVRDMDFSPARREAVVAAAAAMGEVQQQQLRLGERLQQQPPAEEDLRLGSKARKCERKEEASWVGGRSSIMHCSWHNVATKKTVFDSSVSCCCYCQRHVISKSNKCSTNFLLIT